MSLHKIHTSDSALQAAEACGAAIKEFLAAEVAAHGTATLAISGGTTPKHMFAWMSHAGIPWDKVHLFLVDERPVPPAHEQSNYRLALEHLIDPAFIPADHVHRIYGEMPAAEAAERYASDLAAFFHLQPGTFPEFTVIHLGMGPDAHTASLFPGLAKEIDDRTSLVGAPFVEKLKTPRITMMPGVLLNAKHIVFLTAGEDKAVPMHTVLDGPYDPVNFPSQLPARHGRDVTWFADRAASLEAKTLEDNGVSIAAIKAWRQKEAELHRPSEMNDFFVAHHFCSVCRATGVDYSQYPEKRLCRVCQGTGLMS